MNQEEFIRAIKIAVAENGQEAIKSILIQPTGRRPHPKDIALSNWYISLNNADKEMVLDVVRRTTDMVVFGFLCVLDGVKAIEDGKNKGKLSLYYNKGETNVHLNGREEDFLHDLW